VIDTTADRYLVNPMLTVVRSNDDEIIVRFGGRSTTSSRLKDDGRRGILGDIVERLVDATSVADIAEALAIDREVLDDIIRTLIDKEVIILETEADSAFLILGFGLREASALLRATVGVVGRGVLARTIADQLTDVGVSTIVVDQPDNETFDAADLVVVAADGPDLSMFFDANEIALVVDRPWQSVFVDGAELVIGPLFRPGHTGCFHDFDTMDESARSLRLDYLYYKSSQGTGRERILPRFVTDLTASYSTTSIVQHLSGRGSFLEGNVIRVDLERLEIIRDQLAQLPRCPACIQNRPHLRHPFI